METRKLVNLGLPPGIIPVITERGIERLNPLQADAIERGLLGQQNFLVAAPTSSGKTLVGELVALYHAGDGLTAYLVPYKALAREIFGIFQTSYASKEMPIVRAGLLTGDEDTVRGEWTQLDILVSTYEKFYAAMVSSPSISQRLRALVIDELQTVGDPVRGPALELLISRSLLLSEQRGLQIVGLSATIPNAQRIAEWLDAELIHTSRREPPLDHELWLPGRRLIFSEDYDQPKTVSHSVDIESVSEVVSTLCEEQRGPLVIMATTKPNAMEYASEVASVLPVDPSISVEIVDEFRAMGEGTELTENICHLLPRGIAVHTADLSPEQQRVIERGFREGSIRVLSATTTLVAGVNLPIRTVFYPSLIRWVGRDEYISLREYLNGAGRAGRTGYHSRGTCVVVTNSLSQAHGLANRYLHCEPEPVESQLDGRTKEYLAFHIAGGTPQTRALELARAASKTLWGFEKGMLHNDKLVTGLATKFEEIVADGKWAECWVQTNGEISLTTVGHAFVSTGLEPSLVLEVAEAAERFHNETAKGSSLVDAIRLLLLELCLGEGMEDFYPYSSRFRQEWAAGIDPVIRAAVPIQGYRDPMVSVAFGHSLLAIHDDLLPDDVAERMWDYRAERSRIAERLSRLVSAGYSVLDAKDPGAFEVSISKLATLGDQLEFQVPKPVVPFARLFRSYRVRNVGPQRTARLAKVCNGEIARVPRITDKQLESAVGKRQAGAVRTAAIEYLGGLTREQSRRQVSEAKAKGSIELQRQVDHILGRGGRAFEPPIKEALNSLGWNVSEVPEELPGRKPDLVGSTPGGVSVMIECKTTAELEAEVSKKEALDIVDKVSTDYEGLAITIGRPSFSAGALEEALRRKGSEPPFILITAGALIELLLAAETTQPPGCLVDELLRDFVHIDVSRVRSELRKRV